MLKFLLVIFVILNTVLFLLINGEPRIVGGKQAESGQFPYQVSLQHSLSGSHFCGGSLINASHVITAAHCMEDKSAGDIVVWAGGTNLDSGGVKRSVQTITVHEDYGKDGMDSDIALLKLKYPFEFSENIQTIALSKSNSTPEVGAACNVSGWGTMYSGGKGVKDLLYAEIRIWDHATCTNRYGKGTNQRYLVNDNMICAAASGKDACQGDSGGPLVIDNKLIGIVSFGNGCAKKDYPGVYTAVSKFTAWIDYNSYAPFSSINNIQIYAMIIAVTIYSLLFS